MYLSLFLAGVGAASQLTLASAMHIRRGGPGGLPTDAFTILANSDGNCEKGLNGADGNKDFNLKNHDLKNPLKIENPKFPGAESQGGGGNPTGQGFDVFFAMGDPPPGCKNIIMVPWKQAAPPPNSTPGMQIVQASKRGCYYGHVPTFTTLTMAQCCGADCADATLDEVKPHDGGNLSDKKREAGAAARRWTYEAAPPPGDKCSFANLVETNSRAGRQRKITNGVNGGTLPTAWTFSQAISYSMTSTSSETQTVTTSNGVSVSVTAGFDLFAKTDFTAGSSMEWSNAVATSSGKDTSQGNSSTISVALSEPPGTDNVYVSFTPKYLCYDGPSKCSSNKDAKWHNCFPAYLPDGKTLDGDYGYVSVT